MRHVASTLNYGFPVRSESLSADATVLNKSIVTVMGPTPPGTGVM